MPTETDAAEDSAVAVKAKPAWHVRVVRVIAPGRLAVMFNDGLQGVVDLNGLIQAEDAGVFAALRDPSVFEQASVEHGAIVWPEGVDLAPDALHARVMEQGDVKLV